MKRTLVIIALVMLIGSIFTSCATTKGCPGTSGYVGYGYGGGRH